MRTVAKLLPIDGFSYETDYGRYFAAVISVSPEYPDPHESQQLIIEFRNECHGFCLTRKLRLLVSQEALKRDRARIIRLINEWVFTDPGDDNYFTFELRWPDG